MEYEGIVIRPPSEADSLILQTTFGCSHNKCTFCPTYKGTRFRIKDIDRFRADVDEMSVHRWKRVFLADGDALIMPQKELLPRLEYLRRKLPRLERVGIYGNAKAVLRKSPEELAELRAAGLGIIYFGLESGDQATLDFIRKGHTAEQMIAAGRRVKESGIKLSITALLGVAGAQRSVIHAEETGRVLTAIDPDFVGALTIMVVPNTPLWEHQEAGSYRVPEAFELLAELFIMLKRTEMKSGLFMSNHASNYLPVRVEMPHQKAATLAAMRRIIDRRDASALRPEYLRAL
jgi:radical SAM superfamily enzyme YgiQ (UPF0313 family)